MQILPTLTTLAQSQPPPGGSGLFQFGFLILLFGGMWFLIIAPQRKRQKEHQKMLDALQSGDEIVTTGGIYGVITNVKPDRFVLKIGDNMKVEVNKGFVHAKVTSQE